jgi:hypothetical protein
MKRTKSTPKPLNSTSRLLAPSDQQAQHPDTDEHRAGCTHCQYLHDSKLPDVQLQRTLTPQECATVLHGLRLIQCQGRIEGCAAGDCEHFDDYEPLTDPQIDELCEAFNFGDFDAPTDNADITVKHEQTKQPLAALAQVQQSKTWTPPNATAFLKMRDNDEHTVTAPCGCLLEPMGGTGAVFYQCEMHERANTFTQDDMVSILKLQKENAEIKAHLNAAVEHLGTLADYLREAHEEEIQTEHDGDGSLGCSYCDAINEADCIQRAAIGLPDRNWQPWQLAEDDTPQAGRWILVDGNNHDDEHPTNQTLETEEEAKALAEHFNG